MKKLIFGIIAMVVVSTFSYGQTKEDFENFSIIKTEYLSNDNELITQFNEKSGVKLISDEYKIDSDKV
jgi:hypothetical protein